MNASTGSKQLTFFSTPPTPSLKTLREQPGERVLKSTAESSALDLLSAVLGDPDTALRLLSQYPTLSELAHASPANLQRVKGVGRRGAARIRPRSNWAGARWPNRPTNSPKSATPPMRRHFSSAG